MPIGAKSTSDTKVANATISGSHTAYAGVVAFAFCAINRATTASPTLSMMDVEVQ
jgi:hypothetical protein